MEELTSHATMKSSHGLEELTGHAALKRSREDQVLGRDALTIDRAYVFN